MLDTEAAVSLLNTQLWDRIKGLCSKLAELHKPELVRVGGVPITVHGTTKLSVDFNGQTFIMNAVVADMGKIEVIVGLDFLEYHQSVIDTKQHTLDLKGLVCPIPLHKEEMMVPPTKIISVTFENDLYIPGSSQLEVVAKLTGGTSTQTMLIEGQNVSHTPSVLVATAVVQLNTENTHPVVPVRLLNLAPDGVTIYKGTKLDEASMINESDLVLVDEVQEDFHDN